MGSPPAPNRNTQSGAVWTPWPLIITIIIDAICLPILYWTYHEFQKYRHCMYIYKRNGLISRITILYAIFMLAIYMPVVSVVMGFYLAPGLEWVTGEKNLAEIIWSTMIAVFSPVYYFLIFWRSVLLWFEYNAAAALKNEEWRHYLTSTSTERDKVWVIKHKRTYGNQLWVLKQIAKFYGVGTLIFVFVWVLASWEFQILPLELGVLYDATWHLLPIVGSLVLYCKTPTFYDTFKIKNEFKYMIIVGFTIYFLSVLFQAALLSVFGSWVVSIMYIVVVSLSLFLFTLINFGYVLQKGKAIKQLDPMNIPDYSIASGIGGEGSIISRVDSYSGASAIPTPRSTKEHIGATKGGSRIRLEHVLQHRKTLDAFAQHLVSEFSIECLLSVIEFSMFKKRFVENMELFELLSDPTYEQVQVRRANSTGRGSQGGMNRLGSVSAGIGRSGSMGGAASPRYGRDRYQIPNLPFNKLDKSDIVFSAELLNDDDVKASDDCHGNAYPRLFSEMKVRAWLLYERYIDSNVAQLEINISYKDRVDLMARMSDRNAFIRNSEITPDELWTLWDAPLKVMLHLMGDSYHRFVEKSEFEQVEKYMEKHLDGFKTMKSVKDVVKKGANLIADAVSRKNLVETDNEDDDGDDEKGGAGSYQAPAALEMANHGSADSNSSDHGGDDPRNRAFFPSIE